MAELIIDSRPRSGGVESWRMSDEGGAVRREWHPYSPPFFMHLRDPPAHRELVDALEEEYGAEECRFRTVYGELDGYRIPAGREVADQIERQTRYAAELYNVDIRIDQRFFAEQGLFPCGREGESRFSPDFSVPLRIMEITVRDNPFSGRRS